jgi:hypothetical protein
VTRSHHFRAKPILVAGRNRHQTPRATFRYMLVTQKQVARFNFSIRQHRHSLTAKPSNLEPMESVRPTSENCQQGSLRGNILTLT